MGQEDSLMLAFDETYLIGDAGEDPSQDLNSYNRLIPALGGDSTRQCKGLPCDGWVEDLYPSGQLKHRGYYEGGQLTAFKNYHVGGEVQCEFKGVDAVKSVMRTWHANGKLRSESRYADGTAYRYDDYYVNGQLRYSEERHRSEPCYLRMELYAADGKPISLLKPGSGKFEFDQEEFYPGGTIKCKGASRYVRMRMTTERFGTWIFYDHAGVKVREEDYVEGKMVAAREF